MPAILPFEAPRLKVRRARTHIAELGAEIDQFMVREPFRIVVERFEGLPDDMPAQAWTARVRQPVPAALSAILGDAIHNLRGALDLLACDLVRMNGGDTKGVMFPFCSEEADLSQAIRHRKLHRAGRDVVEVLRSLKPYRGGNAALRAIHDLDIQDKHNALIPAIGAVSVPSFILHHGNQSTPIPQWNTTIVYDGQMVIGLPWVQNLKLGDAVPVLFRLVFPKGTGVAGLEMIPTLHDLAQLVDDVIDKLATLCPADWPNPARTALPGE